MDKDTIHIYMQRVRHAVQLSTHKHIHRYAYIQLDNTKEQNDAICSNMDGPIILTEVKRMILLTCGI